MEADPANVRIADLLACQVTLRLKPGRNICTLAPRALPWAILLRPVGADEVFDRQM